MSKFDPYDHLNIILNPDGSITRLINIPKLPASTDPTETALSVDVTLNAAKKTKLRIYRPTKHASTEAKLPIIIYFHGGGWVFFSASDGMVHERCNRLAGELPSVIVSVEYRLAPESRLPAQYDDAMDAIEWVKQQALDENGEKWLREYGDFSRCYLSGCSNGGNIAFHAALRAFDLDLKPINIVGLVLNQPMLGGNQRTKAEIRNAADQLLPLPALDLMWELALPPGADRDHRYCNPMVDGPHMKKVGKLGRCLVVGYGGDPMVDRQQEFVKVLVQCGVRVEARFDDAGFHAIDLIDPRRATVFIDLVRDFLLS